MAAALATATSPIALAGGAASLAAAARQAPVAAESAREGFARQAFAAAAAGQTPAPAGEADLRRGIAALTARLDYRDDDPADRERYDRERDDVTRRVIDSIDQYVTAVVPPGETSQQVQRRFQRLLRTPNPLYGDGPLAKVVDQPAGRALVVAYTIVRPPHHDLATIRAYAQTGERYALVAHTADDFDGFNMFKRELRSPRPNEYWLMAWGASQGANGNIVRFRIYVFDGRSFRTVWSPAEMSNATVTFSDIGFVVDHAGRPDDLHDEYRITPDGVVKAP